MEAYLPMLQDALFMFLFLGFELSVLFIIISAGVSLLQQYIPDSKIQKLLGASKGRGYILAAGLGAITPFCTCSTIPMLRGLLRAKAGFGPTLTFLFASPLLNPIIIGLFVATFGIKVTLTYTCIALLVSVFAGVILKYLNFERFVMMDEGTEQKSCCAPAAKDAVIDVTPLQPLQSQACCGTEPKVETSCCATPSKTEISCCGAPPKAEASCCDTHSNVQASVNLQPFAMASAPVQNAEQGCCDSAPKVESACCAPAPSESTASSCCSAGPKSTGDTFKEKCKAALKDGYSQFREVMPYLLLGISLGAVIYGFVPENLIMKYAGGDNIFAVPIAAVIGIPLYVRVEALIPLSAVLLGKGMGLGAVMALIIGGGGASLTEVILLKSIFKTPVVLAFLAVVLTMAVGAGYIFQFAF